MSMRGKTLLGYEDTDDKRKELSYNQWIIIVLSTFPVWFSLFVAVTMCTIILFTALVIVFTVMGFGAAFFFFYTAFSIFSDLWPSVMKMGASLFAAGITVICITCAFKGMKSFFHVIKNIYLKTKAFLLLKKPEDPSYE